MKDKLGAFVPGVEVRVDGTPGGPLTDITFAAKDLFDVAGYQTGGGNPDWARTHPVPTRHAWAVQALLDAGATLIGKTISCEVSLGILGFHQFFGAPVNPNAPGCLPGGSSSGSASAVAGGLCDTALGTDSGGSVRVPASFCGLYGLRPTHGRVPLAGICPQSPSFDTPGWFTRDAATFAKVAAIMLDRKIPELRSAELLIAEDCFALADPGLKEALRPAIKRLTQLLGGTATPVSLAEGELKTWGEQRQILQRGETWLTFKDWVDETNPCFAFIVARNLTTASMITSGEIEVAQVTRSRARARARELLEGGAILCFPTTPFTAPAVDITVREIDVLSYRLMYLTSFAGLTGVPELSIPVGQIGGKPIGLSLVAWRDGDERLVAIAAALEAASRR